MPMPVGIIADEYNAVSGGGDFDPTDLTGLQGWWDASHDPSFVFSSGVAVATWKDRSANAFHATQPTVGWQPSRNAGIINGLPAVGPFTGHSLITSCPADTKPFSVFAIVKTGAYVHDVSLTGSSLASQNTGCWNIDMSSGKWRLMQRVQANIAQSTTAVSANTPMVIGLTYSNVGAYAWYLNGIADGAGTVNVTWPATTMSLGNVAGDNAGVHPFWGHIGEFTKYNRVLNSTEITQLSDYLIKKWSPTISSPSEIANLTLWLDSSDASTFSYSSGVLVSEWRDKSASGILIQQANTTLQPSRDGTVNGLSAVTFTATKNMQASTTGSMPARKNITLFIVTSPGTLPLANVCVFHTGSASSSTGGYGIYLRSGSTAFMGFNLAWIANHTTDLPIPTGPNIARLIINNTPVTSLYKNGVAGVPTYANQANASTAKARINDSGNYAGTISEIVHYDRLLTAFEITAVENYLRTKWGIT